MADYDPVDEVEDSDPSEILCCRFHKRIGLWLTESSETGQSPLRSDLNHPQITKDSVRKYKRN